MCLVAHGDMIKKRRDNRKLESGEENEVRLPRTSVLRPVFAGDSTYRSWSMTGGRDPYGVS